MKTFDDIYDENYSKLYRLAVRMIDDKEGASDIVQEVFTALYVKLSGGSTILYLSTWLYRATINKCTDYLKHRKRYHSLSETHDVPVEDHTSERLEKEQLVQKALAGMKPTERALLVLYADGFSYKEISNATGMRFTSVSKTLARTLVKMEHQLKTQGYEMY